MDEDVAVLMFFLAILALWLFLLFIIRDEPSVSEIWKRKRRRLCLA